MLYTMKPLTDGYIHHILPLQVGVTILAIALERIVRGLISFTVPITTLILVLLLTSAFFLIVKTRANLL